MSTSITAESEAQVQLALSRENLRSALLGTVQADRAAAQPPAWLARLKEVPAAALAVELLGAWWQRQPLRTAGLVAAQVGQATLQPVAQRHPLALVLGAAAVGALLAWSRPWRWLFKPVLIAGLLPRLLSRAAAPASGGTWFSVLNSLLDERQRHYAAGMATSNAASNPVSNSGPKAVLSKPVSDGVSSAAS